MMPERGFPSFRHYPLTRGFGFLASTTDDLLFFLPITGKIEVLKIVFTVPLYDGQLQTSFGVFHNAA